MNLGRILQLALTGFIGQGITIIGQLLVPPFFLRFYPDGIAVYGEWIALNASINYFGTLNYGIQTYVTNQLTILYNRGEIAESKSLQASAFYVLGILAVAIITFGAVVFIIPIANALKLSHVSEESASYTLYLLILQMAAVIFFSFLTNGYMAVGKLHRGNYWVGAQRLFSILSTSFALFLQASFPILALVQLVSLLLFSAIVLIDVARVAPILLPSLRSGNWRQMRAILKPSAHFGLIAIGGFLTWQGPIILIQRLLGPADVAVFALVRVVFQMSRQILSIASSMISQDIALLVGRRGWTTLRRLYDLSERVVLFLIPVVSVGSLLMCPVLFTVWLHKRDIFEPTLCILMAIVSAVLGLKEHKTQFQTSSNRHETLSLLVLGGYATMLAVAIPVTKSFGLSGFMVTWILWEMIQTGIVLRLNLGLFPPDLKVSFRPTLRLFAFMIPAFAVAAWPAYREATWPLYTVAVVALAVTTLLGVAAYFIFGLDEIREIVSARMRLRLGKAAPSTGNDSGLDIR